MSEIKKQDIENIEEQDKSSSTTTIINYELIEQALLRLCELLEKETLYLKNKDFTAANQLVESKMDIINFLELHKKEIFSIFNLENEEFSEKKDNLRKLAQNLLEISKKNMENVMKEQYINEKTIQIVKDLIEKDNLKYKNYHSGGSKKQKNNTNENKYVLINKKV